MSMLGEWIKAQQAQALEVHAPKVIKHWVSMAKDCGEYADNLETFTAHFHAEDESDAWESLCVLTDCFSKQSLAALVGITVELKNPSYAIVKWSGI